MRRFDRLRSLLIAAVVDEWRSALDVFAPPTAAVHAGSPRIVHVDFSPAHARTGRFPRFRASAGNRIFSILTQALAHALMRIECDSDELRMRTSRRLGSFARLFPLEMS
ncbi:hypothetical protein [Dokdonella sp.]|uniref:hypothetical protein n=1 Tax=Dokdonella sp. TaxID=2291710 RepID=UPI001B2824A5|nr:hypothetical protein [Dokdonella sp.]MBO9663170.1 hypothetical protein [Dokdonella sp.]